MKDDIELGTIKLKITPTGEVVTNLSAIEVDEFIQTMDDLDASYPNTHEIASLLRSFSKLGNTLLEELGKLHG